MLKLDAETGRLFSGKLDLEFADRQYCRAITGFAEHKRMIINAGLASRKIVNKGSGITITGIFEHTMVELVQEFRQNNGVLEETITLRNRGSVPVDLEKADFGFTADLASRQGWRLCAIPFRVQLDGSAHDYSGEALSAGKFRNAVYSDTTRPEPALKEQGILRSEAWAWGPGDKGLVIIKYNNNAFELSVACPQKPGILRFGGAGFCLYGEPSTCRQIPAGKTIVFVTTYYMEFEGGLAKAFYLYRDFLEGKGHGFPENYDPPVNWNELYDVGWYHSNTEELKKHYTREALLKEAQKAKDCGCELLYLDPGWEVTEGTTLWDESRLGSVSELVKTLKDKFGLGLGYRTILRTYKDLWDHKYLVKHSSDAVPSSVSFGGTPMWEPCLCSPEFFREKLKRILAISGKGVKFMMFDEMDWRGPCLDPSHGHPVPATPLDHALAVYKLCSEVRKKCPGLVIEAHDPVWPWSTCVYVPLYFRQGFGRKGSYDENWGFEYMWNCIDDLRTGRALALYYYALGCGIPLYLHITMAADNDTCVFFWWAASTVRHLGIGGKQSNPTVEGAGKLPSFDPEKRFSAYKEQMRIYRSLKPYFVRGKFFGIDEKIHLHVLLGKKGGVVSVFNLEETEKEIRFSIPLELLNTDSALEVRGAAAQWSEKNVELKLKLGPMSPAVICIGSAIKP